MYLKTSNDFAYLQTNASFTCSRVICAVPPSAVNRIDFHPPLPPIANNAFANFSMGAAIKFTLSYAMPHWRKGDADDADCAAGFSGATVCLRNGGDAPFLVLFDSTSVEQYDAAEEFTLTGIVGKCCWQSFPLGFHANMEMNGFSGKQGAGA